MDRRAILTLVGCLLFSASAHAQPSGAVYYCVTEAATGFEFGKERQEHEVARFVSGPFTLKWNAELKTAIVNGNGFKCPFVAPFYCCVDGLGSMLNFNPETMQFIYAHGAAP